MVKGKRRQHWCLCILLFICLAGCMHKVLVVGGMNDQDSFLNTAEVYDPTTGTFTLIKKPMTTSRMTATATTLSDETVLIAGGQGSQAIQSAEILTPSNFSFNLTSPMSHPRVAHTATLLDAALVSGPLANYVLLTGGDQFSVAGTAEIYNPLSKTFIPTGNMTTPRTQHTAILISHCGCNADGKVLIVGGYDNQNKVLASAELYDPATQTFTPTGGMSFPRFRHTATLLNDGNILIAGGASQIGAGPGDRNPALNTAEIYNPRTGRFSKTKTMMTSHRIAHGANLLRDGTVLLTGGQDEYFIIENTAEIYNPATGAFTALSSTCAGSPPPHGCMRVGRDFHITKTLDDGTVLIAGGVDSNFQTVASAEIYSPVTKTFTLTGSMSTPRNGAAASLIIANSPP